MKNSAHQKYSVPARLAAVAVGAVVLAGCSYVNPITTEKPYAASDGLQVHVGDVTGYNLLVISSALGAPATLTGVLHNNGMDDSVVTISIDGEQTTDVEVPANTTVQLGPDDSADAEVTALSPVGPGLIANVIVGSPTAGQFTTPVPVLDGTLPEYAATLEAIG